MFGIYWNVISSYLELAVYLLLIATIIFSFWAQINVNTTFKKYSKLPNVSGMTGYDAARKILDSNGLYNVKIERISGDLTDHYDPKANVIRLSEPVHDQATSAAVGVAAHEAGHAVQHAVGYGPIKIRTAIVPVCNLGSRLAFPLIIVGLLISAYFEASGGTGLGYYIAMAGVIAYGLAAFFQFVTLPVEFNASRRAMAALRDGTIMSNDELSASRKVLTAAALTYVAAFAISLLQFLRLFLMVSRRRD